jgi:hypothetical protein
MDRVAHGRIHGKTIELDEDPGFAAGQSVEVSVKVTTPPRPWGEVIRRTAGVLANDAQWDVIMDEVHESRKLERYSVSHLT